MVELQAEMIVRLMKRGLSDEDAHNVAGDFLELFFESGLATQAAVLAFNAIPKDD